MRSKMVTTPAHVAAIAGTTYQRNGIPMAAKMMVVSKRTHVHPTFPASPTTTMNDCCGKKGVMAVTKATCASSPTSQPTTQFTHGGAWHTRPVSLNWSQSLPSPETVKKHPPCACKTMRPITAQYPAIHKAIEMTPTGIATTHSGGGFGGGSAGSSVAVICTVTCCGDATAASSAAASGVKTAPSACGSREVFSLLVIVET
mmetsp:Transcript_6933/g.21714  ORF Transcript_6933/g.21714 Transcript_6933/m.21714 type:complete len:201 (+) Transcript_6933:137-739(+)